LKPNFLPSEPASRLRHLNIWVRNITADLEFYDIISHTVFGAIQKAELNWVVYSQILFKMLNRIEYRMYAAERRASVSNNPISS
jgi:hypothetical protein